MSHARQKRNLLRWVRYERRSASLGARRHYWGGARAWCNWYDGHFTFPYRLEGECGR